MSPGASGLRWWMAALVVATVVAACRTRLIEEDLAQCPAAGACHEAGFLDPATRRCVVPAFPDGTGCSDGDPCTEADQCRGGACRGTRVTDGPGSGCSAWSAGWDRFDQPFDPLRSFVAWRVAPGTRDLSVRYHLDGAEPDSRHVIGLHLYLSNAMCEERFGQIPTDACHRPATREGRSADVSVFDADTLAVDGGGVGDKRLTFTAVRSGAHRLVWHARIADWGIEGCPGCEVVYQSPGPFGGGVTITIP